MLIQTKHIHMRNAIEKLWALTDHCQQTTFVTYIFEASALAQLFVVIPKDGGGFFTIGKFHQHGVQLLCQRPIIRVQGARQYARFVHYNEDDGFG